MNDMMRKLLVLVLGLSVVAGAVEGQDKPSTPAEEYQTLVREFYDATQVHLNATTDEERNKAVARVDSLPLKLLELAERNRNDPVALDALVEVVKQEIWLENNTWHPGWGQDSREGRAIAILLRDHVQSDRLAEACQRVGYGFRQECETFLRTVQEMNPHQDIQALACLRLAQFLNARLRRLDLLKEQSQLAKRYEGLFGKSYLEALQRQDHVQAIKEVQVFLERAADQYGDVKLPSGGSVGEQAKSELHEILHLSIGKEAPDIEGEDQDGKRFRLSDYRGKVVLLYFWQQFCPT